MYRRGKNRKKQMISGVILLALLACLGGTLHHNLKGQSKTTHPSLLDRCKATLQRAVLGTQMPIFLFLEEEKQTVSVLDFLYETASSQNLYYKSVADSQKYSVSVESKSTYDLIIQSEGKDENHVDEDGNLIPSEGALDVEDTLTDAMRRENEAAIMQGAIRENTAFQPASEKAVTYSLAELQDYETLFSLFYVIDKTTTIDEAQLNINMLLSKDMSLKATPDAPQILIYHTHSQEAFADSVPGDISTTIVGMGERLAEILRNEYGYNVIHDTGQYDVPSRDYAYSVSEPALKKILEENPTIEVIIDLHRDGVKEDVRLVTDINGKPTAQFMFFNGLSRTKQNGDIDYLANPYINDNLAFAFQMQLASNEYYQGITRKIYLKGYRYNMHYRAKSLLIELGAQTNTVEEIRNALEPIAHSLHMVLSGAEPNIQ